MYIKIRGIFKKELIKNPFWGSVHLDLNLLFNFSQPLLTCVDFILFVLIISC